MPRPTATPICVVLARTAKTASRVFDQALAAAADRWTWLIIVAHAQLMTENLALYSRIGYTRYDPGHRADAHLVYLRKKLA